MQRALSLRKIERACKPARLDNLSLLIHGNPRAKVGHRFDEFPRFVTWPSLRIGFPEIRNNKRPSSNRDPRKRRRSSPGIVDRRLGKLGRRANAFLFFFIGLLCLDRFLTWPRITRARVSSSIDMCRYLFLNPFRARGCLLEQCRS